MMGTVCNKYDCKHKHKKTTQNTQQTHQDKKQTNDQIAKYKTTQEPHK